MKVEEAFTADLATCGADWTVSAAACVMWERDCGALPVVDSRGRILGMISDRDITIAATTKNRLPSDIRVSEVMTSRVHSCRPEHDLREALKRMAEGRIRRLPVVDADGRLLGILSITDLVQRSLEGALPAQEVLRTYSRICTPWRRTSPPPELPVFGERV
ncbi:MAG TPA: CBS domain-containing protein [Planctomycetota bacterium]|nr:CBS domain-containing protein [Planctomycetota bacterium]